MIILSFGIFLFFLTGTCYGNMIQCKDETGNNVDWFVMYKIPKIAESANPVIRKGVAYMFMTNNTVNDGWQLSKRDISSVDSIPGKTLESLYNDKVAEKLAWLVYNDQPPNTNSSHSKYGHAKGVIMTNENQGFWLIHSVPSFPSMPRTGTEKKKKNNTKEIIQDCENKKKNTTDDLPIGEYSYPNSGKVYGQSFLCISINSSEINFIANQLIYNQIITYKHNIPDKLKEKFTSLLNVTTRPKIKRPPYNNKGVFESTEGVKFTSFAKTDKWQKDLYDDFVAPQLQVDMLAETWLNGRGKLPSECNGTQVLNVQSIILNSANVEFKSSRDHSKWAVAMKNIKNKSWICIGDINRADTQFNRGGGTVCLNSLNLWKNYRDSVNDVESCPRKKTGFIKSIKKWFSKTIG
ncbi:hypothetical protein HCN44_009124 [Aphidius gifuensis]|uniref:Uncharacterized protein n=1 Tax=Aphidius gifuensis TaxID=684658 RepID=A0A834Y722_APHGI|nr:plancitoxin-1 [Aphidius gifuensis]KAF7997726.1 hypothetical protein HCN44_009124 [Aphidius gifuensis]